MCSLKEMFCCRGCANISIIFNVTTSDLNKTNGVPKRKAFTRGGDSTGTEGGQDTSSNSKKVSKRCTGCVGEYNRGKRAGYEQAKARFDEQLAKEIGNIYSDPRWKAGADALANAPEPATSPDRKLLLDTDVLLFADVVSRRPSASDGASGTAAETESTDRKPSVESAPDGSVDVGVQCVRDEHRPVQDSAPQEPRRWCFVRGYLWLASCLGAVEYARLRPMSSMALEDDEDADRKLAGQALAYVLKRNGNLRISMENARVVERNIGAYLEQEKVEGRRAVAIMNLARQGWMDGFNSEAVARGNGDVDDQDFWSSADAIRCRIWDWIRGTNGVYKQIRQVERYNNWQRGMARVNVGVENLSFMAFWVAGIYTAYFLLGLNGWVTLAVMVGGVFWNIAFEREWVSVVPLE